MAKKKTAATAAEQPPKEAQTTETAAATVESTDAAPSTPPTAETPKSEETPAAPEPDPTKPVGPMPSVGRDLHFYFDEPSHSGPCSAKVTRVHGPNSVDLVVFDHHRERTVYRKSVQIKASPTKRAAMWPPRV
jgi:hypothetical protein